MRILAVAAGDLARAEIEAMLDGLEGVEVLGMPGYAVALAEAVRLAPDVVLVHVSAGDDAPLGVIEALAGERPTSPIVAVLDGAPADEAILAGAAGVLTPRAENALVQAVLDAVSAGVAALSQPELQRLVRPAPAAAIDLPLERLTVRESEVLQLLALGHTNAEVARLLGISAHTAKFHVGAVLGKLGARSRAEAVARASRLGLITV